MRLSDYFRLLHSSMFRQKLRTSLTILSVVIGAVAVISVLALTVTVRSVVESQLAAAGALTEITVSSQQHDGGDKGDGAASATQVKLDAGMVSKISDLAHVDAVSPHIDVFDIEGVRLADGDGKKYQTQIVGVRANAAGTVAVQAGRFVQTDEDNAIVLGSDYIKNFGFENRTSDLIGKEVILNGRAGSPLGTMPDGMGQPGGDQQNSQRVVEVRAHIVGVTSGAGDTRQSYISEGWATKLETYYQCKPQSGPPPQQDGQQEGQPSQPQGCEVVGQSQIDRQGYDSVTVKVDATGNVAGVATAIKGFGFFALTAQDILDKVTQVLTIVGAILGAIGAVSLLVSAIGIVNTMIMAAYERRREIGVMRATGASRRTILTMFTLEAGLIGFWGGMCGLGVALLLRLVGNQVVNRLMAQQGLSGSDVISYPLWLVTGVVTFTTVLGIIAGVLPAIRAARLDPVEALASNG